MSTWTTEDRKEAEKIMNNEPSHKAEPVAYAMFRDGEYYDAIHPDEYVKTAGEYDTPLYTYTQPKDLTDEEIEKVFVLNCNLINETFAYRDFARAILRKAQEK
jgi:hypothetical protein